ncbi:MAG: glycosyltransferase family 4 protein [Rhodospirillum sp.]|nr:glycosyltransferase family 4 protein [Rhodospirillum sp.]MCF8489559.1 glycosyltransferase family 4 protein [Rhodospirillum sp.]MCF8499748.1 glycosyltransferase family 4 protein [Rhodospirillum sp.]
MSPGLTDGEGHAAAPLAIILKGYPRLSETFIAQELLALQDRGLAFEIWSLRHPTDKARHALNEKITAKVHYLPEYLYQEPRRVLSALWSRMGTPGFGGVLKTWFRDLVRDPTPNRIRRFGQALVLAAELPDGVRFLHAHFLHTPASVTRYAALMRGLPWGYSAHAKDIWTIPDWEKREKLASASFGVTCTGSGAAHLRSLAADPSRVGLVYHGLNLNRFPPAPADRPARDGHSVEDPFRLLSVGRLVEKKGYDILLEALALLPPDLHWRLDHIGGGAEAKVLKAQAERLGLTGRITWMGARVQDEVIDAMRAADLFVLPSRITRSGDRDGLPNVLMEAASQMLPLLSTPVSAIPEFITDGVQGRLVEGAPAPWASAIQALAKSPGIRRGLAEAAHARLVSAFGMDRGITLLEGRLAPFLGKTLGEESPSP